MLTIVTKPTSTRLTTLRRVKAAGNITTQTDDELLLSLIDAASSSIVAHCGREFARAIVLERVMSDGGCWLELSRLPVAAVSALTYRNDQPYTDYTIEDPEAGMLYRENGFWSSENVLYRLDRYIAPNQQRPDWYVTYAGGYVLPGENIAEASTISWSAVDNSLNDSANGFPPLLKAGDVFEVAGFTNNNGRYTVTGTPTTGKVVVVETVTTEAAPTSTGIKVTFATLPAAVEQAAALAVVDMYRNPDQSGRVLTKTTGSLSITYSGGRVDPDAEEALPPRSCALLREFRRVVVV